MGKLDPTRDPLPPPYPVGTRLRCIEGYEVYVPRVERPREIKDHPDDWTRVSGRGIEVTIDEIRPGHRGTGRQLRDAEGPMCHEDGKPMLDETKDGYSVYHVVHGEGRAAKLSGRCIDHGSARRWQVLPADLVVRPGDFIKEGTVFGLVLTSGAKMFDAIWLGGSTTRYRHGGRDIHVVGRAEVDPLTREHLDQEALAALRERRAGARIRRGVVTPRR